MLTGLFLATNAAPTASQRHTYLVFMQTLTLFNPRSQQLSNENTHVFRIAGCLFKVSKYFHCAFSDYFLHVVPHYNSVFLTFYKTTQFF